MNPKEVALPKAESAVSLRQTLPSSPSYRVDLEALDTRQNKIQLPDCAVNPDLTGFHILLLQLRMTSWLDVLCACWTFWVTVYSGKHHLRL